MQQSTNRGDCFAGFAAARMPPRLGRCVSELYAARRAVEPAGLLPEEDGCLRQPSQSELTSPGIFRSTRSDASIGTVGAGSSRGRTGEPAARRE
ncbi:hypothetical protein PAHAL_2G094200 [Panicum hallii]|uniref:Uncharacterized protein n=1 Tax=Panicum hallii TaxID=206008 RepID=A0A2T8KNH0_9POAL|nr:hypothetical protein PAHAL_2G094200 [Panicum hallii]